MRLLHTGSRCGSNLTGPQRNHNQPKTEPEAQFSAFVLEKMALEDDAQGHLA